MMARLEIRGVQAPEVDERPVEITWVYNDGGRKAAGFRGTAGDCTCRAIAIATNLPYKVVYEALAKRMQQRGRPRSARNGIPTAVTRAYLSDLGWLWMPTMSIGSGTKVHLHPNELPAGRLIVRLSRHITTVVDGVIHDTYDPSRGGTRCVYGYWEKA